MKRRIISLSIGIIAMAVLHLVGCKKDQVIPDPNNSITDTVTNTAPIANAGKDQTYDWFKESTYLDGGNSSDKENNIISYSWKLISGNESGIKLKYSNYSFPYTIISQIGFYSFELKVTDAGGLFSKDTMNLAILPQCGPARKEVPVNFSLVQYIGPFRGELMTAGNKIIMTTDDEIKTFDISTTELKSSKVPNPKDGAAKAILGNKVFFAGGYDAPNRFPGIASATINIYDIETSKWSTSSLSQPKAECAATVVGNKILIAGGVKNWDGEFINDVDMYDAQTNQWSTTQLQGGARCNITAVSNDNKAFFVGGFTRWEVTGYGTLPSVPSGVIDVFDTKLNTWTTFNYPNPRPNSTTVLSNNKLYLAGGANGPSIFDEASLTVDIIDINTSAITNTCLSKPTVFGSSTSAAKKNNYLVFSPHYSNHQDRIDIYDTNTKEWLIGVLPMQFQEMPSFVSVKNELYAFADENLYKVNF